MNTRPPLGAALLLSTLLTASAADPIPDPDPGAPPSTSAPESPPETPSGKPEFPVFTDPVKGNDLRGKKGPEILVDEWITDEPDTLNKVVIVSFWATWCPHCRRSVVRLDKIADHYKGNVVAIAVCQDDPVKTRDYIKEHPVDIGVASDVSRRTVNVVAPGSIPHAIVISPDGTVRWQGITNRLTTGILDQILKACGIDPPPATQEPVVPDPPKQKQPESSDPKDGGATH